MSFRQPGLSATWFQTCRLCCRGNASGRTCGHAHAQTFPPHACRAAAARRCWAGCGRWRARTSRAPPAARRACCGTRPRCPVRRPRARVRHAPRTALCCFHRRSVSAACARCVALQAVLNIARVRTAWSPQRLPAAGGAAPARRAPHAQAPARAGCSDRLALGGAALCLRFCRPFLGGEARFMARLDPAFYQEQAFRRGARHPTLYPNPTPPYTRSAAGQAL